ncbi:MAG: T9SS type A sorting domain-containing protein, partial [Bacteroidota bacterium]
PIVSLAQQGNQVYLSAEKPMYSAEWLDMQGRIVEVISLHNSTNHSLTLPGAGMHILKVQTYEGYWIGKVMRH